MRHSSKFSSKAFVSTVNNLVINQPAFAEPVANALLLHFLGWNDETKPLGAFLLTGPTGVGKTHAVEATAKAIHGNASLYKRFDCGEYQMDHEVARLIGAPPGYLGHRETAPLLNQSRLNVCKSGSSNVTIILFDEFEKAAPSLARMLLSVLDKGKLSMGDGSETDFKNCLIFFTTNLGVSTQVAKAQKWGLSVDDEEAPSKSQVHRSLVRFLSAEFANRLTDIIQFQPLSLESLLRIAKVELDSSLFRLSRASYTILTCGPLDITVEEPVYKFIADTGHNPLFGARHVKRLIMSQIINPLANLVSETSTNTVTIRVEGEQIKIQPKETKRRRMSAV